MADGPWGSNCDRHRVGCSPRARHGGRRPVFLCLVLALVGSPGQLLHPGLQLWASSSLLLSQALIKMPSCYVALLVAFWYVDMVVPSSPGPALQGSTLAQAQQPLEYSCILGRRASLVTAAQRTRAARDLLSTPAHSDRVIPHTLCQR